MAIQWFPGHMNKTRRLLTESLAKVDGVLEIADARAPLSSRNPLIDEIIGNKPRILLLNKSDLADPVFLQEWVSYFINKNISCLAISAKNRKNLDRLKGEAEKLGKKKSISRERSNKIMIVGVPNCGKSTLINALARQHKAQVADRPGVTRDMALYKISGVDLYDSPGALWPNLEDQEAASRLAALGSIKDEIYITSEAFESVYPFLQQHYFAALEKRYSLAPRASYHEFALAVAKKLGKGDDIEKGCLAVFKDLREGKLGLVSLEAPPIT